MSMRNTHISPCERQLPDVGVEGLDHVDAIVGEVAEWAGELLLTGVESEQQAQHRVECR